MRIRKGFSKRFLGDFNMKKILITLLAALGLFSLTCCASLPTPITKTYLVESGVITNQTYTTASNTVSSWTELNYSNVASLRDYLHNNTVSDYSAQEAVTMNAIKQFLLLQDSSGYKAKKEIELLKRNGYDIIFFNHRENDKKVWMCVTKIELLGKGD